jgi:hypothetical protein
VSKPIYLTDRSRIVAREDCERKRYLNYEFDIDGEMVGIQRKSHSLPLLNGIEVHDAHARLLAGTETVDSIMEGMRASYKATVESRGVHGEADPAQLIAEQTNLIEGMLRAWLLEWVPRIQEDYDIVSIEKPMDWHLAPGLVQKLRFDVVLRRKGDGRLVILDYKTMSYISDAWAKKLERSRQTSLYILAAQELYGEPVEMAYMGLVKGAYRKDTAKSSPFYEQKIQYSPYLYAYGLFGGDGDFYQTAYTPKKGFVKFRTYDVMPMKEWVEWLWANERNTVKELFTFNPPFAPTPREMHRVKELVVREEVAHLRRIEHYRALVRKADGDPTLLQQAQDYLDFVAAPMREERCYQYGADSACAFVDICFNEGAIDNVLEDGAFEPREAHHGTGLVDEEAA